MGCIHSRIRDCDDDALFQAVSRGDYNTSEELLDKGADPDIKYGYHEQSPLHEAARNGSESLVKLLLERGANKESRNGWGDTPLTNAAARGHLPIVTLLHSHGASIHNTNIWGGTPLSDAARNHHYDVCSYLIRAGVDIN